MTLELTQTRLAPWNSPEQVARYLGVSVAYLAAQRHAGRGPAWTRVGRLIRYSDAAIESYLEMQTTTP